MTNTQAIDDMLRRYVERIVRDKARRDTGEITTDIATDCRQNHKLRKTLLNLRFIEHELQAYLTPAEHQAFSLFITRITDLIRRRT